MCFVSGFPSKLVKTDQWSWGRRRQGPVRKELAQQLRAASAAPSKRPASVRPCTALGLYALFCWRCQYPVVHVTKCRTHTSRTALATADERLATVRVSETLFLCTACWQSCCLSCLALYYTHTFITLQERDWAQAWAARGATYGPMQCCWRYDLPSQLSHLIHLCTVCHK